MINHIRQPSRVFLFALIIFIGTAVAISSARASDASEHQQKLNGGYYLLHQLCEDEDQLPLLLDMKHAPPELVAFADQISKTAKDSLGKLDHFQDGDKAIQFDRNPLPDIEQNVRDSIKADKQHQLLFGTSDSEFDRALLISQIEACTYGIHLSKVLADQENDPVRVKNLKSISEKWTALRDKAYRLLRNY